MPGPLTAADTLCMGCGCLCDDIRLTLDKAGHTTQAAGACELGQAWFTSLRGADASPPSEPPTNALSHAAELLTRAERVLVCGLKGAATTGVKAAIAVADRLSGCVDWTTCEADAAATLALQAVGASGASLGEVAQRADLVVYWQCDPLRTHPRHLERYSAEPSSPWLPRGRQDRTLAAIGAGVQDASLFDLVIRSQPQDSLATLQTLRAALREQPLDAAVDPALQQLADRIRASRYTAFFYDHHLATQGEAAMCQLTLLAQQAHPDTRVVTCPLGAGDNAAGADAVMTWQTGYPMAVSFAGGCPEYGPGEYTTQALLERGEVDAVLVASAAGLRGLNDSATQALRRLPSVVLCEPGTGDFGGDVVLPAAPLGAAPGGDVMRCDGMMLPLRNRLSGLAGHGELLEQIAAAIAAPIATGD